MKKITAERKKIISGRARKDFAASSRATAANESLRTLLRRAVKSASVPGDLDSKVRNLLWKQF